MRIKQLNFSLWEFTAEALKESFEIGDVRLDPNRRYRFQYRAGKSWFFTKWRPMFDVSGLEFHLWDDGFMKVAVRVAEDYESYSGKDVTIVRAKLKEIPWKEFE